MALFNISLTFTPHHIQVLADIKKIFMQINQSDALNKAIKGNLKVSGENYRLKK